MEEKFYLGQHLIGKGTETVLLPELGTYFNSDLEQAYHSLDQCRKANFTLIKGEVFHTADIVYDKSFQLEYKTNTKTLKENYHDIIARKVLPFERWREVYGYCKSLGMDFVVSAYDMKTIDFLSDIGAACIKFSGSNLNNIPLLRYAGQTSIPVMLDARRCSIAEVCIAMETLDNSGCSKVILNHSPDGSPSPAEEHNLTVIETYSNAFGCPIGFSCHYAGPEMVYAAAALGYSLIEKPFCIDPDIDDVDTPWALPLSKLKTTAKTMKSFYKSRGCSTARFNARPTLDPARMGIYSTQQLNPGETISIENCEFKWPCIGISVSQWNLIEGMTVNKLIHKNSPIFIVDIG